MRIRFQLRTFLIAVTIVCVLLAIMFSWYRSQQAEFHRIQNVGMKISRLHCAVNWAMCGRPGWLEWADDWQISRVLFFRPITAIIYSNAAEVINLLPELPTIDGIGLGSSAINDEILRQLAANKSIKYLALESEDPNQPLIPNVVELADRIRQKLPGVKVAW